MPRRCAVGRNLGLFSRRPKEGSAGAARTLTGPGASPVIEALEDRRLLSRTLFVAPFGNDANAGSLASPFRTIQRAATLAQSGDRVMIEGGTYRETVRPAHSGVTFQSYNGQQVTVSGADPISGWSNYRGSIYDARQSWDLGAGNNQVFLDGQMINEARWPNTSMDVSHQSDAHVSSWSGNTLRDPALNQPAGFWKGAMIHITPGQQWVGYTGAVLNSGPGWIQVSLPAFGKWEQPTTGNSYYLMGKFNALDGAGEWYRDPTSGQLYVWTPRGDSPAKHLVEAKRRKFAFDLSGRSNITLEGINIFAATIKTDWGSTSTVLDHLTAKYISQFSLMSNGWSVPSDSGIELNGANSLLENSLIDCSAGDGVYVGQSGTRVTNTTIQNVDYTAADGAAIRVQGNNAMIDHNTIAFAGRSGINHHSAHIKILNNVIHDIMLQTTDGGGIYTVRMNGAGAEIAGNTVYNINTCGFGGVGIFLDDNSSNFIVHDNQTWNVNSALKLNYTSFGNQIYNNSLNATRWSVEKSGYGFDWRGTVLRNNIFYKPAQIGTGAVLIGNRTA